MELESALNILRQLRARCKGIGVDSSLLGDVFKMIESLLELNGIEAEQLMSYLAKLLYLSDFSNTESIDSCLGMLEEILNIFVKIDDIAEKNSIIKQSLIIKQSHKNAEYSYEKRYGLIERYHKLGKYVVYTVITGNYDELKEPIFVDEKADYICFTDNRNMRSNIWKIRYLENEENYNAVMLSRLPKILPHRFFPEYEYSIYIDGKMRCIGNLEEYVYLYGKNAPMLCFPHFVRDCIYDEAEECINLNLDDEAKIRRQMSFYRSQGMPEHFGLIDACCMVRKHNNKDVIKTMELWWTQFKKWDSRRDQLSFNYACWKSGLEYDICNLYCYNNNYINLERENE